jgi:hypothetical protein
MAEVQSALVDAGLPFGAKASQPQDISTYPFHHDQKNWKIFWDVRKVSPQVQQTASRGIHVSM